MNCPYVESRLSSYLDGELTGREMLLIREHLCSCCDCDKHSQQYATMKQMLGSLTTPDVRPGFEDLLVSAVLGDKAAQPNFWERVCTITRGNMLSWGVGAVGLAAVLMIWFTPEHQGLFVKDNSAIPSGITSTPVAQPIEPDIKSYQHDHDNLRDWPLPFVTTPPDRGR